MSSVITLSPSQINTSACFFVQELARSNHSFAKIAAKILEQERISVDEGVELISSNDLMVLGYLATFVRERKSFEVAKRKGYSNEIATQRMTQVWWNTNLHLNPTNVCIGECDFCSFARKPNEEGAYTMTVTEAVNRVQAARLEGATEVHIVGGLNPKTLIEYYSELIREIKKQVPGIHVKAFTAVEIEFFSKFAKLSFEEVFKALIAAGLDSMPGGGAEIFSRSVRDEMCPDKIPADTWVEIHQTAHRLGLKTNATMLAGIGEKADERIDHLDVLRKAQDGSLENNSLGGFQTMIPLSCHYEGNDLLSRGIQPLTGVDQLKNIALSRIMLDNFDNIKAYWIQLGEKMAQIALNFGANDLDGTVKAERITNAAGARKRGLTEDTLINIIRGAHYTPIERDTLYDPIEESRFRV